MAKASGAKVETQITKLTDQTKELGARVLDLEQKNAALLDPNRRGAGGGGEAIPNIGQLICGDDKFTALRSGNAQRANIEIKQALRTVIKSVLTNTGQSADSPQVNFPSVSQFLAPTPQQAPGRRLLVLQALNHLPVTAASVTVPVVSDTTDGAAPQSHEGSAKAESVISVTGDVMNLPSIATFLNLSKQVWADIAALPAFLQSWLSFFVMRKLESLIISGSGNSTDKILGLTNAGTQYIPVEDHGIDRIAEACSIGLPAYGYSPTLIILSTVDYMRTLTQRDANGRYVGAGWQAGFNTSLWARPRLRRLDARWERRSCWMARWYRSSIARKSICRWAIPARSSPKTRRRCCAKGAGIWR